MKKGMILTSHERPLSQIGGIGIVLWAPQPSSVNGMSFSSLSGAVGGSADNATSDSDSCNLLVQSPNLLIISWP